MKDDAKLQRGGLKAMNVVVAYPAPVFTNHGHDVSGGVVPVVFERKKTYPCRAVLDGDRIIDEVQPVLCSEPSEFYAKGNDARYGHVCRACWEGLDERERERYAEKRFELSNALYGKFAEPWKLPGGEP